jgi:predicted phage terminase large subunit-like protein
VTFKLSTKQDRQLDLMGSAATHIMAYGGSRSGKTFGFVRGTMIRAMAHRSRHAMLRYRFNHIKASIILDTLPKVMELCFPGTAPHCHLDKTDWFYAVPTTDSTPNSGSGRWSEVWFGGLDDKERTEKILGQEYATIYLNECSQIPYASRNMAMTRLAQNTPLRLKAYYDCNPPGMAHWTYRLFIEKRDPDRKSALANPDNYAALVMNPADNMDNLPATYLEELQNMGEAMRRRFLLGQFADVAESALWTLELLDQQRIVDGKVPDMVRIVVAVDPSGVSGEEDKRSDEVGIVVVGLGKDGRGYVLEDLSGRMAPAQWGQAVVSAYERHDADCVVAEENFGGAMVAEIVRSAAASKGITVPYRAVKASRGKIVRAEPVSVLFEQRKVSLVGVFPDLEDQLCAMTTAGYVGSRSPDRADAMIWGLASLFPALTKQDHGQFGYRTPVVNLGHASAKRRRAS